MPKIIEVEHNFAKILEENGTISMAHGADAMNGAMVNERC